MPVIRVRFKILAPITFPKLNPELPCIAEDIPTNNSGRDVAMAIRIKAAENSDICKKRDILLNDLTKNIPLIIKIKQDMQK